MPSIEIQSGNSGMELDSLEVQKKYIFFCDQITVYWESKGILHMHCFSICHTSYINKSLPVARTMGTKRTENK